MAADQGRGSGVPRVLRGPVRRAPRLTPAVPGPPLVTGATGFAGSHLVDQLARRAAVGRRLVAPRRPRAGPRGDAAGHAGTRSTCSIARRCARARRAASPRSSITAPASPHVGESWRSRRARCASTCSARTTCSKACATAGLTCPVLVTGSALVYRPSTEPITEDDPIGPSESVRREQARAGDARARRATLPVLHRAPVQPRRARGSRRRTRRRASRGRSPRSKPGRREPVLRVGNLEARRDITDVRDTVRAYRLSSEHGRPAPPVQRLLRARPTRRRPARRARRPVACVDRHQVDPARLRPSDNPVIAGDRSRIDADTGWTPGDPDRADARRSAQLLAPADRRRTHDAPRGTSPRTAANSCTSRWERSRCCCAT